MKTYGGVVVQIHMFLTLALIGGECLAPHTVHFTPWKSAPVSIV
jgi:hypothetical protein